MKTKIFVFEAKSPYELVKKINADEREFFATQIFLKGNIWVCFAYYKSETPAIKIEHKT